VLEAMVAFTYYKKLAKRKSSTHHDSEPNRSIQRTKINRTTR
ncbi:unnamed protein product, partial [Acidithrix sp. C25]